MLLSAVFPLESYFASSSLCLWLPASAQERVALLFFCLGLWVLGGECFAPHLSLFLVKRRVPQVNKFFFRLCQRSQHPLARQIADFVLKPRAS